MRTLHSLNLWQQLTRCSRIDKPDVLRRIDNAWDIKPHSRYTDIALLDNSLPPIRERYPYLSALKSFVRSQTIQVRLAEALSRDPNGLRTVIQLMHLVSENQVTWTLPSRNPRRPDYNINYHWFYLWLRWVDERNLFFKCVISFPECKLADLVQGF